jgi:NADH-quinone oxidoreductase subunit G
VEAIADIDSFNGTVVYRCNPVLQFSPFTAKASQLAEPARLVATEAFIQANGLEGCAEVVVTHNQKSVTLPLATDAKFAGNVAFVPTFDQDKQIFDDRDYRFAVVDIRKV